MSRLPPPYGRLIDRAERLPFRFDGYLYSGHPGDTIASALLANGIVQFGRSPRLERVRGIRSLAGDDAQALVCLTDRPTVDATTTALRPRMEIWRHGGKHGIGGPLPSRSRLHAFTDIAVVGSGPAGLAAALSAAQAGRTVTLIERAPVIGGSLNYGRFDASGTRGTDLLQEIADRVDRNRAIRVLTGATCTALEPSGRLVLEAEDRIVVLDADSVVLATGALDRLPLIPNNDLPGLLSADTAQRLIRLYGVSPGRRGIVVTATGEGYGVALDLIEAGIDLPLVVDLLPEPVADPRRDAVSARGIAILTAHAVLAALPDEEEKHLAGLVVAPLDDDGYPRPERLKIACDFACFALDGVPNGALALQAGAHFASPDGYGMTLRGGPDTVLPAGTFSGYRDLEEVLADGRRAGRSAAGMAAEEALPAPKIEAQWLRGVVAPGPGTLADAASPEFTFLDLDTDCSVASLWNAVAAGQDDLARLVRFGGLTGGASQPGVALSAALNLWPGDPPDGPPGLAAVRAVCPAHPETLQALAGRNGRSVRESPLQPLHRDWEAVFRWNRGWTRPEHYAGPDGSRRQRIAAEVDCARNRVGLLDLSWLEIVVLVGQSARETVHRLCGAYAANAPTGTARTTLLGNRQGEAVDELLVWRLADDAYRLASVSDAVPPLIESMDALLDGAIPPDTALIDLTGGYGRCALVGPQAGNLIAAGLAAPAGALQRRRLEDWPIGESESLSLYGMPAEILRIDRFGEIGFEILVDAGQAQALWERLDAAGAAFRVEPVGTAAQGLLLLEAGEGVVGWDRGAGVGWEDPVSGAEARAPGLSGFTMQSAVAPHPGSIVTLDGRAAGIVTSAALSPTLGQVIGLARMPGGTLEPGREIGVIGPGGSAVPASLAAWPFYDPTGSRQNLRMGPYRLPDTEPEAAPAYRLSPVHDRLVEIADGIEYRFGAAIPVAAPVPGAALPGPLLQDLSPLPMLGVAGPRAADWLGGHRLPSPFAAGQARRSEEGYAVLRLEEHRFLVIPLTETAVAMLDRFRPHAEMQGCLAWPAGQYARFTLSGPQARAILAQFVGKDLRPGRFGEGDMVPMRFASIGGWVHGVGKANGLGYDLLARADGAGMLWDRLADAVVAAGGDIRLLSSTTGLGRDDAGRVGRDDAGVSLAWPET